MGREYRKLNDKPIEIECVEDENEGVRDFLPSFLFENQRHYICDYVRVHNNPWVGGEWPEYIHGMEEGVYYDPIYIEIINAGEAVNVYRKG